MRFRSVARALVIAYASLVALAMGAQALPAGAGSFAPPARDGVALQGTLLANVKTSDYGACQAQCKRTTGCTGYNFAYGRDAAGKGGNCSLFSGTLNDLVFPGVVSCRMPCTGPLALLPPRPPHGEILRQPSTVKAPVAPAFGPILATPLPVKPVMATGTLVHTGVSGYEVVEGAAVAIPPLSSATASAQCPAGKVALGAGYRVIGAPDAQWGFEVRGAIPAGRLANVQVRNANVFVAGRATALAVCVNSIPGLRVNPIEGYVSANQNASHSLACGAGERLVGGGVMGSDYSMIASGPQQAASNAIWKALVIPTGVMLPGSGKYTVTAICASEASVDGWELIEATETSLGARARTEPVLTCPTGKALLAVGVSQRGGNPLDMSITTLAPPSNGAASWLASIGNRNTINGNGPVQARFAAVCARRQ
jgi:hypothetical protein